MEKVISKDGTPIAFDQLGDGQPVILVGGAFSYRLYSGWVQLAELLAENFRVINYDRRGRGDSGDNLPYVIEREIEDLEALITRVGGTASVFGMSSGAVLALKAARSLNITKLALYEPPFIVDDSGTLPPPDFVRQVTELIAANRRDDAVRYFMKKGMGVPAIIVLAMRFMPGMWPRLRAVAHTLPYDAALLEGHISGKPLPEAWKSINVPTLVMNGEKSIVSLRSAVKALTDILPNAEQRTLEGLSHSNIKMDVIAGALKEFFA